MVWICILEETFITVSESQRSDAPTRPISPPAAVAASDRTLAHLVSGLSVLCYLLMQMSSDGTRERLLLGEGRHRVGRGTAPLLPSFTHINVCYLLNEANIDNIKQQPAGGGLDL